MATNNPGNQGTVSKPKQAATKGPRMAQKTQEPPFRFARGELVALLIGTPLGIAGLSSTDWIVVVPCLLIAGAAVVWVFWVHEGLSLAWRLVSVALTCLIFGGMVARSAYPILKKTEFFNPFPRNLAPENARLTITGTLFVSPSETKTGWPFFNISYKNSSSTPALRPRNIAKLRFSDTLLSPSDTNVEQDVALPNGPIWESASAKAGDLELYEESQPIFFSAPDREGPLAAALANNYEHRTPYIYLFVTIKFKDRTIPNDATGVSETCRYYVAYDEYRVAHVCGRNRSFIQEEVNFTSR